MKDEILKILCEIYGECYTGYIKIKELSPKGYDVALSINNKDEAQHISAELDKEDYLKYFKKEAKHLFLTHGFFYDLQLHQFDDPDDKYIFDYKLK